MAKKELRLSNLVSIAGKPEIITLWKAPEADPAFMKAVKENRVLTLIQEPASKRKDYAIIGFHKQPYASYLLFPKPLPTDEPLHVVGIKDDLLIQPKVADPISEIKVKLPKPPSVKPAPLEKAFNVAVKRTAVLDNDIQVQATNKNEAGKKALEVAESKPFDLGKATLKNAIKEVRQKNSKDRQSES